MKIILDSGAFGAFNRGIRLDLNEYILFVKEHQCHIEHCVSLDVIPGEPGRRELDQQRLEVAARESYDNHQRMLDAGLSPIPVYHQDDDPKWLEKYLEDGETYIGLSTNKQAPQHQQIAWLDDCFKSIGGRAKAHGFGVTAPLLLQRYPWKSCDSATWLRGAGFGEVPIPLYNDGKPDYSLPHLKLAVTEQRGSARDHIEKVDDLILDRARHYLHEYVGIDFTQARYSLPHRWKAWLTYFKGHQAVCRQRTPEFELVFVTNIHAEQAQLLSGTRRLISYFDIKDKPVAFGRYMDGKYKPKLNTKKTKEPESEKPKSEESKAEARKAMIATWYTDKYRRRRAMALYGRCMAN